MIYIDFVPFLSSHTGLYGGWGGCAGGRMKGKAYPALFRKSKECPDLEKNALIVSIFGINFPFKM